MIPPSFVETVAFATLTGAVDAVAVAIVRAAAAAAVVDLKVLMPHFHSSNPYASAEGNRHHYCDRHVELPSPDEVFD